MDWNKFFEWLKQPSTIKAIILFTSLAGLKIAPDHLNEIVTSAGVLYAGIAAFLQKS